MDIVEILSSDDENNVKISGGINKNSHTDLYKSISLESSDEEGEKDDVEEEEEAQLKLALRLSLESAHRRKAPFQANGLHDCIILDGPNEQDENREPGQQQSSKGDSEAPQKAAAGQKLPNEREGDSDSGSDLEGSQVLLTQAEIRRAEKERIKQERAAAKAAERERKAEEREQARREKAAEKERKAEERELAKLEKEREKRARVAERAAERHRQGEARGKFAEAEVAALLHPGLLAGPLGDRVREVVGEAFKVCELPAGWARAAGAGAVRWTHRGAGAGGAAAEGPGVRRHAAAAAVLGPAEFLALLSGARGPGGEHRRLAERAEEALEAARREAEEGAGEAGGAAGGAAVRVVWLLNGVREAVDEQIRDKYKKTHRLSTTNLVTPDELDNAISWLSVCKDIEVQTLSSDEETAEYLHDLTRALSDLPYLEETTLLHCVKKQKTMVVMEGLTMEEQDEANMFARILQMVPGVSERKALALVRRFPSLRRLAAAYRDPGATEREKEDLLQDCITVGRGEKAISRKIYHFFTANDPDKEIVS